MMTAPRIALIHATPLAIQPVNASFYQLWPDAKLQNILDDSLSRDLASVGHLTADMVERFIDLAQYAKRVGCQGILFTCSAFGEAIEAAAAATGIPTLKPNEAMFEEALQLAINARPHSADPLNIGLVATFEASIASMREEFLAMTAHLNRVVNFHGVHVPLAMSTINELLQALKTYRHVMSSCWLSFQWQVHKLWRKQKPVHRYSPVQTVL